MLLLATGKESAVALFNWPALAALIIAGYLLAKGMTRGNRIAAIAVVVVLLSVPMVEFQTLSAYVDLYGTAFLIAAFALLLRNERTGGTGLEVYGSQPPIASSVLFLSAAACGISLGTKPIFWVYGAGYSVLAVLSFWKSLGKRSGSVSAKGILLIAVGLLLPSAFWFGRAVQATKNPVFPMQVAIAGHVVFPGYPSTGWFEQKFEMNFVRSRREWFIYPWTEWKRDPGYLLIPYGEGSGVGAAFAALVPIGVLFLIYRSFILRLQSQGNHPSPRAGPVAGSVVVPVVQDSPLWFSDSGLHLRTDRTIGRLFTRLLATWVRDIDRHFAVRDLRNLHIYTSTRVAGENSPAELGA